RRQCPLRAPPVRAPARSRRAPRGRGGCACAGILRAAAASRPSPTRRTSCYRPGPMSEQMSMFDGGGGKKKKRGGGAGGPPPPNEVAAPLHLEARRRYLNYALSVITSRALPDVRDGLKPVQRRIIYGMFQDHRLTHEAKYQKCAKVVGTIMGQYHPHGDV